MSNWRTLEVFGIAVFAISWYTSAATIHTCTVRSTFCLLYFWSGYTVSDTTTTATTTTTLLLLLLLLRPGRGAKYCDQRFCMSVGLSICLFARISQNVTGGRGSTAVKPVFESICGVSTGFGPVRCFHTVGWVTGRASGLHKSPSLIRKGSSFCRCSLHPGQT